MSILDTMCSGRHVSILDTVSVFNHDAGWVSMPCLSERVQCAARATGDAGMEGMREVLLHFLELDDYLSDQLGMNLFVSQPEA